jgi:hypothetical protein
VEELFREFRVFGRINDISIQPGFATVEFLRKRAATSARNCIHGEKFGETILQIGYEKKENPFNNFAKFFSSNLKLSIPLLLALVAGISFAIFDPWREFSITNQLTSRFDLSQYRKNASRSFDLLYDIVHDYIWTKEERVPKQITTQAWSEREEEAIRLSSNLKHAPDSVTLIQGPKGSGKSKVKFC